MATIAADKVSYEDLYSRWERSQWSATELDFGEDARHWREELSDDERSAMLRVCALFFSGEDEVADGLAPYIDAAPREEQKYILAAQQADEARHAVLFARFTREVIGYGTDGVSAALEAVEPHLTAAYQVVFGRLRDMAAELREDPSPRNLAVGVALYHVVIEAGLAQPGQHLLERFLGERGIMPALREGIERVINDEQRHIGAGVKMLADLTRDDPDRVAAVGELLREVLPQSTALIVPEDRDMSYLEHLGFSFDEITAYGARAIENALGGAGISVAALGIPTLPPDLTAEERAARAVELTRVGVLGPRAEDPPRDSRHMGAVFDAVRRGVKPDHGLKRRTTLLWDFEDAEPWHLTISNGDSSVAAGAPGDAALTFRCRYGDWLDVMAGRETVGKLLMSRRLRVKGNRLLLLRLGRVFED